MVYKQMFICFTICCFVISTQGCYVNRQSTRGDYDSRQITLAELDKHPGQRIQRIVTIDNKIYEFPEGAYLEDDMIIGYTSDGEYVEISREQVKTIYVYRSDSAKYANCCVATAAVLVLCGLFGYLFFLFVKGGPQP
jgi:hypothetical protein